MTLAKKQCKNYSCHEQCHIHREPDENEPMCSICMLPVRTRGTRTLDCSHTFHKKCIEKWKHTGNYTCPVCRADFDPPRFKATISVEPLTDMGQNIYTALSGATAENIARSIHLQEGMGAELRFTVENVGEINNVLQEMGVMTEDLIEIDA